VKVCDFVMENGIQDPDLILVGEELVVPGRESGCVD
jgi:hypothetical protein